MLLYEQESTGSSWKPFTVLVPHALGFQTLPLLEQGYKGPVSVFCPTLRLSMPPFSIPCPRGGEQDSQLCLGMQAAFRSIAGAACCVFLSQKSKENYLASCYCSLLLCNRELFHLRIDLTV